MSTSSPLEQRTNTYEERDIRGLLADRLERGKERLDHARKAIKALCEPVIQPQNYKDYLKYFVGDPVDTDVVVLNE
jgi:type I restriction enzyme R subunit